MRNLVLTFSDGSQYSMPERLIRAMLLNEMRKDERVGTIPNLSLLVSTYPDVKFLIYVSTLKWADIKSYVVPLQTTPMAAIADTELRYCHKEFVEVARDRDWEGRY